MKGCQNVILTIIFIALLVIGITGIIVFEKCDETNWPYWLENAVPITAVIFILVGAIGTLVCGGTIIGVNINHDVDYQNKLYEREVLEYRVDRLDDDLTGNELIYNDVVAFNNDLRLTKKHANSLWLNWFYNQDIAALDYVELPSG